MIRLTIWLPPLLWMAAIMWFSGDAFSGEATASVVRPLLQSLLPWATAVTIDALHWLIRKSAHLTEYALLASLWFVVFTRDRRWARGTSACAAFLIAVGWAVLDELRQASGHSRTGSVQDVGIDATGALLASLFTGFGWRHAIAHLTTALLWTAAVGGGLVIALNLATGVGSGALWLTVPMAVAVLVLRWRRSAARTPATRRAA